MIKVYCDVCGIQVGKESELNPVTFTHFTYSYTGDRYEIDDKKMCCKQCKDKYNEALAEFNNVYWKTHIEKKINENSGGGN